MNTENLVKIYQNHNPDRKDASNKQYAARLSRLAKDFDDTSDKFLEDSEKVLKYLEEKHTKTALGNVLYSIIGYLEAINKDDLSKIYRTRKEFVDDQIRSNYSKNQFFGSQEDNIISYPELVDYVDTIKKLSKKTPDDHELKNISFLLQIYLRYPTRNDYANLQYITWKEYKKIQNDVLDKNYVIIRSIAGGKKTVQLSISDYKMFKKYGTKITDIEEKPIKQMFLKDYRDKGQTYLFTYTLKNEVYEKYYLSQMFMKYSKRILKKNIGSTLMYKIIIGEASKKYDHALSDDDYFTAEHFGNLLKEYAKNRGHSKGTQKTIYTKSPIEIAK